MGKEGKVTLTEKGLLSSMLDKLTNNTDISSFIKGWNSLSVAKKIRWLSSVVLSFVVGVAIVLWAQDELYISLYDGLGKDDVVEIRQIIDGLDIDYKIDELSGSLMVSADKVRELKLMLAGQGLPRESTSYSGYQTLGNEGSLGVSNHSEIVHAQRVLENEIVKTIAKIQYVKSARVLLALPSQSSSVSVDKAPSASVVVDLYQGRQLEKGQIEAIIHLVSSSVPRLESTDVTVVDQKGRILSHHKAISDLSSTSSQLDYKKNVEEHLMQRIENILIPLVGHGGVQTQVSADIDFTVTEKTQEMFYPDSPALISEKIQGGDHSFLAAQDIPDMMFNQPLAAVDSIHADKVATRNYELDKIITHTRLAAGVIRRLSIAVVIDYQKLEEDGGSVIPKRYSSKEVSQFNALVKQAVGFDSDRGDQITVSHVAFKIPEALEVLPEMSIWEQEQFVSMIKQVIAIFVVLFLMLGVIRPLLCRLVAKDKKVKALLDAHAEASVIGGLVRVEQNGKPVAVTEDEVFRGSGDLLLLETPQSYNKRLEYVQKLIDENPLQVSQILSEWVESSE